MRLFSDQRTLLLESFPSTGAKVAKARLAESVNQAYRWIGSVMPWSYLHRRTQIVTNAPYNTGTIAYTASTRVLTLTGGTWPAWTINGLILINSNVYAVQQVTDSTHIILQQNRSPVVNVTSGTTYNLVQQEYLLPVDYVRTEEVVPIGQWWWIRERAPTSMLETARLFSNPSRPWEFTVRGSLQVYGRMAMELMPPPDANYTIDVAYFAQPRQRTLPYEYTAGVVSNTGSAVTGTGTAFTQSMVGCRLRQGTVNNAPVGEFGELGSTIENTIQSVQSATTLTLYDAPPVNNSGVLFVIDDPVDFDRGCMDEAFCRMCEYQFAALSQLDDRAARQTAAYEALQRARAMDVRLSTRQQDPNLFVPGLEALVYGNLRQH